MSDDIRKPNPQELAEAIEIARQLQEDSKPPFLTSVRNWFIVAALIGVVVFGLAALAVGAWTIGGWIVEAVR